MPGGDRSGPEGLGPMTGRRMGYCVGSNNPEFSFRGGFGRGRGFYERRGGGFGYRSRGGGYGYQAYPETDFYNDILGMEEIKRFTLKKELSGKIFSIGHDTKVVLMKKDNLFLELFLWTYKEKTNFDHLCISFNNREAIINKAFDRIEKYFSAK